MSTTSKPKVTTADQWGGTAKDPGLKRHYITLPSSAVVGIEIPDLAELIASGKLPNSLVDIAIEVAKGNQADITADAIKEQPAFYKHVVQLAVKEPEVTDDLYAKLPTEDKEMIVEIATRQRDVDAVYDHIGGLHKNDKWRKFRGLGRLDEDVADV